jgi:mannose/cellobiose epimerase-like protein (N-acyl-D-glucosamine 2-epimerase family)
MSIARTAAPDAGLLALVADLRRHFDQVVLPLWQGSGFNTAMQLPYESVGGADGNALPVQRYRTMACARQLYVFAASPAPGAAAHAATLFESLRHRFAHPAGGWVYSVDAQGAPLDATHDLYTYAFVVFACAVYYGRSRDARALVALTDTVARIESGFTAPAGLYWAQMKPDFSAPLQGVLQNPVMHLTEAYLAAREVSEPQWFGQALRRIANDMAGAFLHAPTRCITELPLGSAANRIEPGHQFEWYSLLAAAPDVFDGTVLADAMGQGSAYAQSRGVDSATEGVCASLDLDGAVSDAVQRIWAQTEYARALALRGDAASLVALQHQLSRLRDRFLHAGGWYEVLNAQGGVVRGDMPSTTPYHLATCYAALPAA